MKKKRTQKVNERKMKKVLQHTKKEVPHRCAKESFWQKHPLQIQSVIDSR